MQGTDLVFGEAGQVDLHQVIDYPNHHVAMDARATVFDEIAAGDIEGFTQEVGEADQPQDLGGDGVTGGVGPFLFGAVEDGIDEVA